MDFDKYKLEVKDNAASSKEDLLSITNNELIEAYKNEIYNRSLELEDIQLRVTYITNN